MSGFSGENYSKYQHKLEKLGVSIKATMTQPITLGFTLVITREEKIECKDWIQVEEETIRLYNLELRKLKLKRLYDKI